MHTKVRMIVDFSMSLATASSVDWSGSGPYNKSYSINGTIVQFVI